MSEPITLTERECAVFASMIEYVRRRCINFVNPEGVPPSGNAIARWMEDWLVACATKSASPPRVPGASAQSYEVGVQSGPGQPTPPYVPDIADALDGWAAQYSEPENINARTLREAAAEIRRLRAQVQTERRAGIEAAARYHDEQAAEWHELRQEPKAREYDKQHRADAAAIRALADKAPDAARKGG